MHKSCFVLKLCLYITSQKQIVKVLFNQNTSIILFNDKKYMFNE
jgi:hypothetical protein